MRLRDSITTRMALGYGVLVLTSITVISLVFYFATVGMLQGSLDNQISTLSDQLADTYGERPLNDLIRVMDQQLESGLDSEAGILLVLTADGERVAGNRREWQGDIEPLGELLTDSLPGPDPDSEVRYMLTGLGEDRLLLVGYDMQEQVALRSVLQRALVAGAVVALLLVVAGAVFFRRQLEQRIGEIRRAAHDIEQGNLNRRIPIAGDDEFQRLGLDINRMLDRIQLLMEGVRHVSNSIAHDLRTPLTRIRNRLEASLRAPLSPHQRLEEVAEATTALDDLLLLFDKLLQIAEAEAGVRTRNSTEVDFTALAHDMVELYDASAEEAGVRLVMQNAPPICVQGDRDLLASAVASLIDNALKYAVEGGAIVVELEQTATEALLCVRDFGPGIPDDELSRVTQRFYRVDKSRSQPGNGLGLAIVRAIAQLHGGTLRLENASPGLRAMLSLPLAAGNAESSGAK